MLRQKENKKSYLDFIHSESAEPYITGITKENENDIIVAKYNYKIINAIDDILVRIEYKKHHPYYSCYKGKMQHVTEDKNVALSWKKETKKGRKVKFITNHYYKAELTYENRLGDGNFAWNNADTSFGCVTLNQEQIKAIKDKLSYLNNKYKLEEVL